MRSSISSFSRPKLYIALIVILGLAGLVGIELAVRAMPNAYCKAEIGDYYGCSNRPSLKRYLTDKSTRLFLGDSHVEYIPDHAGFRDYSMPAMLPTEMLMIMKHLSSKRSIEHVIIGLAAHHMQDKRNTRLYAQLEPQTFGRQYLPGAVFALESSMTTGIKKYLWDLLFRRELPVIDGRQTGSDEAFERERREFLQQFNDDQNADVVEPTLWWQRQPIYLTPHEWLQDDQARRNARARARFKFFYPHPQYRKGEEYAALLKLFELLGEQKINACFIRYPISDEYTALTRREDSPLYRNTQAHLRKITNEHGFKYIDTAELELGLRTIHFRDSDHLLIPVIEGLAPVIVNACFPKLSVTQ